MAESMTQPSGGYGNPESRLSRHRATAACVLACLLFIATMPAGLAAPSPIPPNGAISDIVAFLEICPTSDKNYGKFRGDFSIRRNGSPIGFQVCSEPVSALPPGKWTNDLVVVQALRTIYYMDLGMSGHLPWTEGRMYDWLRSRVSGFDIRDDASRNWCCETIDGKKYIVLQPLQPGVLEYKKAWDGLSTTIGLYGHEARHRDGFGHVSCCGIRGGCDQTYDERALSAYGIQWFLFDAWWRGTINVGMSCTSEGQSMVYDMRTNRDLYPDRFCDAVPEPAAAPHTPGGACPSNCPPTESQCFDYPEPNLP